MIGAFPWFHDVVSVNPIRSKVGFWMVPEKPGLGIEIDEEVVARHPYQRASIETKHAVMADGTIVDW